MSSIPSRAYSAPTSTVSSRAAGSRSTVRSGDVPLPSAERTRGAPGPSRAAHQTETALLAVITASTPPGSHHAATAPLTSGPSRMPTASADPEAALAAVTSAAVSEISGSSALCTGLVRLMVIVFAAASTHTTANGASASVAAATTAIVTVCAA